jgi:hypothetical protein
MNNEYNRKSASNTKQRVESLTTELGVVCSSNNDDDENECVVVVSTYL